MGTARCRAIPTGMVMDTRMGITIITAMRTITNTEASGFALLQRPGAT